MAVGVPDLVRSLRVFIASPGDVAEERQVVRDIVAELNGALRQKGWEISVLGWEDRGPTGGRAQANINEDVRLCDVFVGIAWKWWGTPTGDQTSGFAEEWAIARERHDRSGQPDLWLYFKKVDEDAPEDGQLNAVRELRREVEEGELAFHKTFDDASDFERLLRARLLAEVLDRSGLTRTDLDVPALDWGAAYDKEPVALLPQGTDRAELADEVETLRPEEAANLLAGLADDAEERGFKSTAEGLRIRACRVWLTAGKSEAGVALFRSLLRRHIWELRLEEAEMLVRQLQDDMPPELTTELKGWSACIDALEEPSESANTLAAVMLDDHSFPLDPETEAHWYAVRWRCLLEIGKPEALLRDQIEIKPVQGGVHLELALLRADALRTAGCEQADAAWADLRLLAVQEATERPHRSAWISTRVAFDAVAREDLDAAETGYADAATRWTKVGGASTNTALAFFSAQAASRLRGDWSFSGWSWRPIAAAQIGRATGPAARGEEFERRALNHSLGKRYDSAVASLRGALWCYLRAGFLDGVMRSRALLAGVYADAGDLARAVLLSCETGESTQAGKLAGRVAEPAELAARMGGSWPTWAAESRFAVLAQIGGYARQPAVSELAVEAIAATRVDTGEVTDNTRTGAAEALAALGIAVEDPAVLRVVIARLAELAGEKHYALAQSGRLGLRMLDDIGVADAAEILLHSFLTDERPDEPSPVWIAKKMTQPEQIGQVRRAALAGHRHALAALIEAGGQGNDRELQEHCTAVTRQVLQTDLGMTADGSGIHGLMALDIQGSIAAASGDHDLIRAFGEMLLVYASESRWPMVNRVSAIRGLSKIALATPAALWLERLRPFVRPESDHDQETAPYLRDMWAQAGDLESTALAVAARIATIPLDWLSESIYEARFDERTPMRLATWFAAAQQPAWFDESSARFALRDDSAGVRIEALNAWRRQGPVLPSAEARRLAEDSSIGVRLALVSLMEERPEPEAMATLERDPSAYVRGVMAKRLRGISL
jgi:hypothetical protein